MAELASTVADAGLPPIRTELALAKRDLDEYGVTRFAGAASMSDIEEARERLEAQAAGEQSAGVAYFEGGEGATGENHFGPNQRIRNLINKGAVFRRLAMNRAVHELMRHMLGEDFLLSSFGANIVRKGGVVGGLHGDQQYAPAETPYALAANCLWMITDFTAENGATRVLPRSHRLMDWPELDQEVPGMVPGTGPAGAVLVFDGRVWHGTGASQSGEVRMGLLAYHCRPFLRQKENFTLSVAPEVLDQCSPELRALLGFKVWKTLGGVFGVGADGPFISRPTKYITELAGPRA